MVGYGHHESDHCGRRPALLGWAGQVPQADGFGYPLKTDSRTEDQRLDFQAARIIILRTRTTGGSSQVPIYQNASHSGRLPAQRTQCSLLVGRCRAYGAVPESTLKPGHRARANSPRGWILVVVAIVAISFAGCAKTPKAAKPTTDPSGVVIEFDEKTDVTRLNFTKAAKAAKSLGIVTEKVTTMTGVDGLPGPLTVPYASVLYTAAGETIVYTNPEPLVFVKELITIDRIQESTAVLSAGPALGTSVVTLGAAELTGIEFGVGK